MANELESLFDKLSKDLTTKIEAKYDELTVTFTSKISAIDKTLTNFRQYVGSEITKTKDRLDNLEQLIPEGLDLVTLQNEVTALKYRTEQLEAKLNTQENVNESISKLLDDQVNRNLRKTLIFRGIQGNYNESWSKTSNKLAKFLSDIDQNHLRFGDILHDIDRAHRPNENNETDRNGQSSTPPIFVQFNTWKAAQYYMHQVIDYNKKSRNEAAVSVYVDQMYSKELTERRKKAIDLRKQRRTDGDKSKMLVKFPATLMKFDDTARKYVELQKF